mmetsp:Transcript_40404/g.73941  ORF Transcript_40404/g.73941 Transcript_40404/m.73941 type:complete len:115 (+) Transcript_40404:3-347(+)
MTMSAAADTVADSGVVTAGESASSAPPSHTGNSRTPAPSTTFTSSPVQIYGIPVGVVILANKDIYPFKRACYKALPQVEKIVFRGVEPSIDSGYQRIHVQTEVAAAIVDGNAQN